MIVLLFLLNLFPRWSHAGVVVASTASSSSSSLLSADSTQQQPQQQQQQHPHRHLLIGGEDAPPHRFPYFVSLEHYCGGALIAPDIVLTAGHCKPRHHDKVHPAVGRYTFPQTDHKTGLLRTKDDISDAEYMSVESAHRHPKWRDPGDDEFVHDFAIIKLATSSTKPYVKINRDAHHPVNGDSVLVIGAGNTVPDRDSRPNVLQQVSLQAISNEACEQAQSVERNASYAGRIDSSHLCTGYGVDNSRDACDYDSGSPILIANTASWRDDVLVGLVSWGMECADPDFPGVNARVSDAADWIDEMVCKLSLHPPRDFCPPPKGWGHWIIDATGFATGFVTALLLVGVLYCVTTATARRRRLRNYGSWKGRWSCCGWWRSLQWAAAPDHQKLLPLKTDSSLSSSSDASSDTSYGSVGNVEVPEHPGLAEVPS